MYEIVFMLICSPYWGCMGVSDKHGPYHTYEECWQRGLEIADAAGKVAPVTYSYICSEVAEIDRPIG